MIKNIYKSVITTIIGVLFLLADLFVFIYPMFIEKDYENSWVTLAIIGLIGIGLILSPDDLFKLMKKKADEKL